MFGGAVSDSSIFIIINHKEDRYYYVVSQNIKKSIDAEMGLLDEGLHKNRELQRDYAMQKSQEFSVKILMKDISSKAVDQILDELLDADIAAYNHKE